MSQTSQDLAALTDQLTEAMELQVREWPDRAAGFDAVMRLTRELGRALLASAPVEGATGPGREDAERLTRRGVFLGGSPKGGTTMFVQLFDGHPELVVMPGDSRMVHLVGAPAEETAIDRLLGYWLRQVISPNALPPFWCLGRRLEPYRRMAHAYQHWRAELADRPSGPFIAAVLALAHAQGRSGAQAFVEKTCANVLHPERIYTEMPEAKIIQIVRDPFATLAALAKQSKVRRWDWTFDGRLEHVRDILRAAIENPGRFGPDRYRLVSYERLVADPEPVMRDLAAFVGVSFHPILTRPTVLGLDAESNSMFGERRVTGRLLAEDAAATEARWREVLIPGEQEAIRRAIGPLAQDLGYPVPRAA